MKSEVPRIPIYSYSHVFWWQSHRSESRRAFFNRLHMTRVCPFCNVPMRKVDELSGKCTPEDYVVICDTCGFWFGRGEKNYYDGPAGQRGTVGLVTYKSLDDLEIPPAELISFLNKEPKWITHVNPYKAEELVCQLLEDAFRWEVKHLGGRRDGGIDALAVLSGSRKAIVQIKWRQNPKKAESVSTVRELAGTLIARGVPRGILVTTSNDLSSDAKREAGEVSGRVVRGIGKMDVQWKTYSNILDMLEISSQRVDGHKRVPFATRDHGDFCIFDGGGIWDADWHHLAGSTDLEQFGEAIDPYDLIEEMDLSE